MEVVSKRKIVETLAERTGMSQKAAGEAVAAVEQIIAENLRRGDMVRLSGLGSFSVLSTQARTGRNPRTGESINIPPKQRVRFKAAKTLLG